MNEEQARIHQAPEAWGTTDSRDYPPLLISTLQFAAQTEQGSKARKEDSGTKIHKPAALLPSSGLSHDDLAYLIPLAPGMDPRGLASPCATITRSRRAEEQQSRDNGLLNR